MIDGNDTCLISTHTLAASRAVCEMVSTGIIIGSLQRQWPPSSLTLAITLSEEEPSFQLSEICGCIPHRHLIVFRMRCVQATLQ